MSLDRLLAAAELVGLRDRWGREVAAVPPVHAWRRVWRALDTGPDFLQHDRLEWVFSRPRGVGPTRARRLLREAGLDPGRRVGELSDLERRAAQRVAGGMVEAIQDEFSNTP